MRLVNYWSVSRTTVSTNCDTSFNFNEGCGTQVPSSASYGQGFNSNGGGFYALERNKDDGIKVWFWPRSGPVPLDVSCNEDTVDPGAWGTPVAYFPTGKNCSYEEHLDAHMLVFDLTFCVRRISLRLTGVGSLLDVQGDLAGNTDIWKSSGCSTMNCSDCKLHFCHYTGTILIGVLYKLSTRLLRHSQMLTGRSIPYVFTSRKMIDILHIPLSPFSFAFASYYAPSRPRYGYIHPSLSRYI